MKMLAALAGVVVLAGCSPTPFEQRAQWVASSAPAPPRPPAERRMDVIHITCTEIGIHPGHQQRDECIAYYNRRIVAAPRGTWDRARDPRIISGAFCVANHRFGSHAYEDCDYRTSLALIQDMQMRQAGTDAALAAGFAAQAQQDAANAAARAQERALRGAAQDIGNSMERAAIIQRTGRVPFCLPNGFGGQVCY